MEHVFVADTNLFFECKKLEDLAWSDLGVDPVVIALTKPVQAEIDKHKNGGGRTRKRALEVFSRVREMLGKGVQETVIQKAGPQVILRLVPAVRPDPDRSEVLDYTVNDDRIVGIVSALEKQGAWASVSLLTDDGGAAATAASLGLGFQLLSESWKRPPQVSDEAKEIAGLKKDLAAYRAQEPNIELRDTHQGDGAQHVVRRVPNPLGASDIERLIAGLEARHPMETDFSAPEAETWEDGTEVTYEAPNAEAVQEYQNETYPNWIAQCRSVLTDLHVGRSVNEASVTLSFGLKNTGTRPAIKLRITFEALGDIHLRRVSDDQDTEDAVVTETYPKPAPNLPTPPSPPIARLHVKEPPTKTKGLDITTLKVPGSTGILGNALHQTHFRSVMRDMQRARDARAELDRLGVGGQLYSQSDTLRKALRLSAEHDRLREMRSGAILRGPMIPPRHDPEGFYYSNWPTDVPAKEGGFTCDLFRHLGEEEVFEVDVVFPKKGDVRGAIRCRVHAENLTKPVELNIPVSRTVENFDLTELAEKLATEPCSKAASLKSQRSS